MAAGAPAGRAGRLMRPAGGPAAAKSMLRFWENGMFLRQAVSAAAGAEPERDATGAAGFSELSPVISSRLVTSCPRWPCRRRRLCAAVAGFRRPDVEPVMNWARRYRPLVSPGPPPPLGRLARFGRVCAAPGVAGSFPSQWRRAGCEVAGWRSPSGPPGRGACWDDRGRRRRGQVPNRIPLIRLGVGRRARAPAAFVLV